MIFATVGTHEDPFNRLVHALEGFALLQAALPGESEEIVIQAGTSTTAAPHCTVATSLPYDQMSALMQRARVIITHGGPASIMQAYGHHKVPIVVPRQATFGEHVDDHQVRFARRLSDRAIVILDIADLSDAILHHAARTAGMHTGEPRSDTFSAAFDALIERVVGGASGR